MIAVLLALLPALATGGFALVGKFIGLKSAQVASGDNTVTQSATVQAARDASSPIAAVLDAIVLEPLALSISFYYAKIFFVDKLLALGTSTDPLSPELHSVAMAVLGYYTLRKVL